MEGVPDTEEQPDNVGDTDPVEETEGQLEGLSLLLKLPLAVPDAERVPLDEGDWDTLALGESVTVAEPHAVLEG
jgi:hypothetical protein